MKSNVYNQGRSQRGVQGVQLNPPSKLTIFMTIVYAYGKIDGRNIIEYMLIHTYNKLATLL